MTGPDHRTNSRMCFWGTGVREPARLRSLVSIFRAAWLGLVEAVRAGLWGCIVAGGYDRSPGVAAVGRAFLGPVGSFVSSGQPGVRVLGEGGADPGPGGGDRGAQRQVESMRSRSCRALRVMRAAMCRTR